MGDHDHARSAVRAGKALPLRRILKPLRRQYNNARVLDAQVRTDANGQVIYDVKLLGRDGRVTLVTVDGLTGKVRGER